MGTKGEVATMIVMVELQTIPWSEQSPDNQFFMVTGRMKKCLERLNEGKNKFSLSRFS